MLPLVLWVSRPGPRHCKKQPVGTICRGPPRTCPHMQDTYCKHNTHTDIYDAHKHVRAYRVRSACTTRCSEAPSLNQHCNMFRIALSLQNTINVVCPFRAHHAYVQSTQMNGCMCTTGFECWRCLSGTTTLFECNRICRRQPWSEDVELWLRNTLEQALHPT